MPIRGHRTVAVDLDAAQKPAPKPLNWPWYLVAALGPVVVLLGAGLVLSTAASVGWLTSPDSQFGDAARLAGQVLVLAHGAPVTFGGQLVTLTPLGISLGLLAVLAPAAQRAARQAGEQVGTSDDTGRIWADPEAVVFRVAGVFAASYTAALLLLGALLGAVSGRLLLGGLVLGGISGLLGACRGIGFDPTQHWPSWLRAVPRAMLAAGLVVLAGGSLALVWALWNGRAQMAAIFDTLDGGIPALVLLAVLHLAYLPNFILACCSWVLGAGVSVGDGSLITIAMTDVGVLPAIPIFGIVPQPGPVPATALCWLLVGVLAGVVAAVTVGLARPRARFDETALVGALAGALAGLLIAIACSLGAGSLGTGRLTALGARMPELIIFAPTLLSLSGLAGGLLLGLVRWPTRAEATPEPQPEAVDSPE